ncbi:MAG: hypothetical protein RI572_07725 [Salegentibacter sp.]|uniref:TonB protein C-terminal n=1 Tax=Salegentibacter flavus TaxID=287099 RepID=A0A1I5BBA2_9FLAO|nr:MULTISPECIES: hypothetical protein [Salegentibacter]MDR9457286.1 hypothetical protein [Salegentibacter sp.]SFN71920.1 hypothetical protein SAMN05660413_02273 [Salegentibacter flavus]
MKNLQLFLLVLAIGFGTAVKAAELPIDPSSSFKYEVEKLLEDLPIELEEEEKIVNLTITFNQDNEIVVLSVECNDPYIKSVIKKRLNYKKVNTQLDKSIREYKLPIRLQA